MRECGETYVLATFTYELERKMNDRKSERIKLSSFQGGKNPPLMLMYQGNYIELRMITR